MNFELIVLLYTPINRRPLQQSEHVNFVNSNQSNAATVSNSMQLCAVNKNAAQFMHVLSLRWRSTTFSCRHRFRQGSEMIEYVKLHIYFEMKNVIMCRIFTLFDTNAMSQSIRY